MIVHLKVQTAVGFLMCASWSCNNYYFKRKTHTTDFTSTFAISFFFFFSFCKIQCLGFLYKIGIKRQIWWFFILIKLILLLLGKKNQFCVLVCAYMLALLARSLLVSKDERFGLETRNMLGVKMPLYSVTTIVHHIWIVKTEEMSFQANIIYYEEVVWMQHSTVSEWFLNALRVIPGGHVPVLTLQ